MLGGEVKAVALAIKINPIIVADDEVSDAWQNLLDNPPDSLTYIRLPGESQSGPCANCAQYFYMEHDGSGASVPLIPLHENCVCSDIAKEIADLTNDIEIDPQERGEWLRDEATEKERMDILGAARAQAVESGIIGIDELYKRAGTAVAMTKNLETLARSLHKKSKRELVSAARSLGFETAGLDREDLVDAILGRSFA